MVKVRYSCGARVVYDFKASHISETSVRQSGLLFYIGNLYDRRVYVYDDCIYNYKGISYLRRGDS